MLDQFLHRIPLSPRDDALGSAALVHWMWLLHQLPARGHTPPFCCTAWMTGSLPIPQMPVVSDDTTLQPPAHPNCGVHGRHAGCCSCQPSGRVGVQSHGEVQAPLSCILCSRAWAAVSTGWRCSCKLAAPAGREVCALSHHQLLTSMGTMYPCTPSYPMVLQSHSSCTSSSTHVQGRTGWRLQNADGRLHAAHKDRG